MLYLNTKSFKTYFKKICSYGKYILYTRFVKLKSGISLPIYFFSKHLPKSGTPTSLPDGYIINENPKSHMPYLKKIRNNDANYKSDNKEKNEKNQVIYVIKIPKKGTKMGKWVIKNKDKILSSHRTKQAAIKNARKIAIRKKYRVLVKNINGKFSFGFKP